MSLQSAFNQALYSASQAKFFKKAGYGKEEVQQEYEKKLADVASEAKAEAKAEYNKQLKAATSETTKSISKQYDKLMEESLKQIRHEAKGTVDRFLIKANESEVNLKKSMQQIRDINGSRAIEAYQSLTGRTISKTEQKDAFKERMELLRKQKESQNKPSTPSAPTTTKPKEDKK